MRGTSGGADGGNKTLVPAELAETGAEGQPHQRFVGDDDGANKALTIGAGRLGNRQDAADAVARMAAGASIVEVEIAAGDAVDEGR